MKKRKGLYITLGIIAVIIILCLIHTIRNSIIITSLQNNIQPYINSENYHIEKTQKENDNSLTIENYYKKDGKEVMFIEKKSNDSESSKLAIYTENGKSNLYSGYSNPEIIASNVDSNTVTSKTMYISNLLYRSNLIEKLCLSASKRISSVNVDGKDCYKISSFWSNNEIAYYEKETGLLLELDNEKSFDSIYSYDFDNINDSIFDGPFIVDDVN